MDNEHMKEVLNKVKNVDAGINELLIPILQDTIMYGNKHNKRIFILNMIELAIICVTVVVSLFFIYKQNIQYQEFLSQFDFETTETVYQDLDSGEGDIVNPSLTNNK